MQQANIINIITNKYEPQQKHRLFKNNLKLKSMGCHNQKSQPTYDTKEEGRNKTKGNQYTISKQTHEKHIDQLSLSLFRKCSDHNPK